MSPAPLAKARCSSPLPIRARSLRRRSSCAGSAPQITSPKAVPSIPIASIQVWAQAVEQAGTVKLDAVLEALRSHTFNTVIGHIGFDDNGDVTGTETYIWYVWKDGKYVPKQLE